VFYVFRDMILVELHGPSLYSFDIGYQIQLKPDKSNLVIRYPGNRLDNREMITIYSVETIK